MAASDKWRNVADSYNINYKPTVAESALETSNKEVAAKFPSDRSKHKTNISIYVSIVFDRSTDTKMCLTPGME